MPIHGTVTDARSGLPLESVEVSVSTYQYSELTNGLGDYELELAVGTWKLDFVKEGYEPLSIEATIDSQNTRVRVDAALAPITPVLPDLVGTWFGENLPLGAEDDPPLADLVLTLNPNKTFESLLFETVYPETMILREYSTRGTYTYDPSKDELTMWQDLDRVGPAETPWTLIRQ